MSARPQRAPRKRRRVLGVLAAALGLACGAGLLGLGASSRAASPSGSAEPTPETDASVPAEHVTMIGASPEEPGAPGANETWGVGEDGQETVLVRYTSQTGWSLGPGLVNAAGQPLSGFKLGSEGLRSPLAGQMTPHGSGALIGHKSEGGEMVLVRAPGGPFKQAVPVPSADLGAGESLLGNSRAPLIAALDEAGGGAGALVVPFRAGDGVERWVLHYDGEGWTREPIEIPASSSGEFRVLALGASSPSNAWLLARVASPAGSVELFRRHLGEGVEGTTWEPVGGSGGEPLTVDGEGFAIPGDERPKEELQGQILTVTREGVWIDGERPGPQASTTLFFRPEGASGKISSWCTLEGAPPGTQPCEEQLPEPLPTGPYRSIAWANASTPFGERVITGLPGGVSLRLQGDSFARVLALGGGEGGEETPGESFGAAFSSPLEGWLGQSSLPVHLTLDPEPSRLSPWPVTFRHPLLAIAPAPGQPIGALSSEALAVGELGAVARYEPGKGWVPESLLGAGGRVATPRLRAVAWPTPSRAYAVGDHGQMWLWRSETGLWEPDPATPFNFRGNMLGIAFDPNEPARGYAVGEGAVQGPGVLLRYGKTWTQEPAGALPEQAQGAEFTSIAFAGSEAIVAYRKLLNPGTASYVGGLIVNDGSGWQLDEGAAAAMGREIPWAVAGLPDGGAAFAAGSHVYERESSGAAWTPVPTPVPGGSPGSLALFRENGALRAIASGSAPFTYEVEDEPPPPPEAPPNLLEPYKVNTNPGKAVLRQTATGWSDQEHELNDLGQESNFSSYDTVFQPDPISTVLVSPTGTQGWAIGGFFESENHGGLLDTADIDRYPSEGATPPGIASAPVEKESGEATFAIGGGAACAAPCADRENARIGPDVWLSAAQARAAQIPEVRAFLYTGPGLANRRSYEGHNPPPFPYAGELARYAALLASGQLPTYVAASPTDLNEAESESSFEAAFDPLFAQPFGELPPPAGITPAGAAGNSCAAAVAGCHAAYAFDSEGMGGRVRVIVLDNDPDVAWLESQLDGAKAVGEPAIVVGNADLNAQRANHEGDAAEVIKALVLDGASAYFYDATEQNVHDPLEYEGKSIEAYGSGTLGYVDYEGERTSAFLGASGFFLAQVDVGKRDAETNRAPVSVRLVPNIGELALEAENGTLLRRSQVASFQALARRPRAGNRAALGGTDDTDPYIPIPSNCVGAACASGTFAEGLFGPEYTFSSSRPDIGNFVEPNLASAEPDAVELNAKEEPVPDAHSGLFCAYNAGTTVVTISAGGLSSSLTVTVQAGSVRRPCGTTPLKEIPVQQSNAVAAPPAPAPAPSPTPAGPAPAPLVPLPAPPTAGAPPPPARPAPKAAVPAFFVPLAPDAALLAALPPPVPTPARPSPPSGTSAVTTPVEVAEHQEEQEEAPESVSNKAVAYSAAEHEPSPAYVLGIVLIAALAGASVRRRPRGGRRELRVAPATISSVRARRREEHPRRPL